MKMCSVGFSLVEAFFSPHEEPRERVVCRQVYEDEGKSVRSCPDLAHTITITMPKHCCTPPNPTQPNQPQPNPTQPHPNPTQPNPTQPNPTHPSQDQLLSLPVPNLGQSIGLSFFCLVSSVCLFKSIYLFLWLCHKSLLTDKDRRK